MGLKELKVYIGITMIMFALQFPQISMYWSQTWKVITQRLKCVYDPEVTPEKKIWKIQPLLDRILAACHAQDRPQELIIDEIFIPFTGKCSIQQYCLNKANPVGLKVLSCLNYPTRSCM